MTAEPDAAPADAAADTLRLGLVAPPGLPAELAEELADDLPELLARRVSDAVDWQVAVVVDPQAGDPSRSGMEAIEACRERLLREDWSLAVCLTDVPLRIGHRPVVADASATHGVALISLPALGAMHLRHRAGDAIVQLLDGLMGERVPRRDGRGGEQRHRRVGRRIAELAAPIRRVIPEDEDIDVRFVTAVVRGNLLLLTGMVRANRPWRLVAGLSRALAAALGAVAFGLVQSDPWRLADALGPGRLVLLMVLSVTGTIVSLIVAHDLWEHAVDGRAREQVVLFNVATALTVTLGIGCLYVGLFALTFASAEVIIADSVLSNAIGHRADLGDYVRLAWMVSSLATVGGALGAGLESDAAVRQAAYGHRSPENLAQAEAAPSSHSRMEV